jgi:hypothetical protein
MTPSPQSAEAQERDTLMPCPFCLESNARMYPPTCDKRTLYNPADRAFPLVRCKCGAAKEGIDWDQSGRSAIRAWNARASLPSAAASGEASAVEEVEAQAASEQTAADVRAIHERMKAELAHNELPRVIGSAGEATDTGRFRYRPDGPFGPDVIDSHTGKWMSIDLAREYAAVVNATSSAGEPVTVEAVATIVKGADGLDIDWLVEGGICALAEGETLLVSQHRLTDETGSGEVYLAPPTASLREQEDEKALRDGIERQEMLASLLKVLKEDAARLDWLDEKNKRFRMGWKVGSLSSSPPKR